MEMNLENAGLLGAGAYAASKAAEKLIEKVASAAYLVAEPTLMRRKASAEIEISTAVEAANSELPDTNNLLRRTIQTMVRREIIQQLNREDILARSLPLLDENSEPTSVADEWMFNFFERCGTFSAEEMKDVWAKMLAGEANSPGQFSRHAVNILSMMDSNDVSTFTKLLSCSFDNYNNAIIIFGLNDAILGSVGVLFDDLNSLRSLGLIAYDAIGSIDLSITPPLEKEGLLYGGYILLLKKDGGIATLPTGKITLTRAGFELAKLVNKTYIMSYLEYVRSALIKKQFSAEIKLFVGKTVLDDGGQGFECRDVD